jgi:hypothetical protein
MQIATRREVLQVARAGDPSRRGLRGPCWEGSSLVSRTMFSSYVTMGASCRTGGPVLLLLRAAEVSLLRCAFPCASLCVAAFSLLLRTSCSTGDSFRAAAFSLLRRASFLIGDSFHLRFAPDPCLRLFTPDPCLRLFAPDPCLRLCASMH